MSDKDMLSSRSPMPGVPSAATPFVGRQGEREQLRRGLRDALAGRMRLFMLPGEPGIGKTRLAEELAAEAGCGNAQVVWGRCWEGGDAPAFWPWIQVIRSCVHGRDAHAVASLIGSAAPAMLRTFPELRDTLPGFAQALPERGNAPLAAPNSGVPDAERFRLFDSITTFLGNAAALRPLVIILDDVHDADADSLLLLRFLVRSLRQARILVLAAYREVEARISPRTDELLGDIAREAHFITLRGLTEADARELVEQSVGRSISLATAAALYNATEGNPFFLGEIVRLLIAEKGNQQLRISGLGPFEIPDSVRAAIRRRLRLLSEEGRDALKLASAIGREFDLAMIRSLSGLANEQLLAALDDALACDLIEQIPGRLGCYHFSHVLICETLYGDLPRHLRERLHLKIGETLEELYRTDLESHLSEIAHHYAYALPAGPAEKAFEYARRGAQKALEIQAYDDAVRLYRAALEVLQMQRPANDDLCCEMLLCLGDSLNRAGLFNQCRVAYEEAAELAERLGDTRRLALAALGRGTPITEPGAPDQALTRLLEEALSALGKADSPLRAMLLARLAWELYWSESGQRISVLSSEAIEIARRLGDVPTLIYVFLCTTIALWTPDNLEERLATTKETIRLADEFGDKPASLRARQLRFVYLLESGDIASAREELDAYCELTTELRQPFGISELCLASLAFLQGRFDEGERLALRALAIGESLEGRAGSFRQAYYIFLLILRLEQGRLGELEPILKALTTRSADAPFQAAQPLVARCALALCYSAAGRQAEAAAEFAHLVASDVTGIPRDLSWLAAMILLSEVCAELGDAQCASSIYELLRPYASRNALLGWHACCGSVSYYLARLATTMSRLDEARAHFEAALQFNREMGARPWVAHTEYEYAAMLLRRGAPGDREKALKLLGASLETSSACGMKVLEEKARELLARTGETRASPQPGNIFRKEGEFWTISYRGHVSCISDIKGLGYVAHLMRYPGTEVHCLDLLSGAITPALRPADERGRSEMPLSGLTDREMAAMGMRRGVPEDAGEMLDAPAKAAYGKRLGELREEVEEASESGDVERAERARDEIDALSRELSRAVGLGGRDRRAASESERARVNVSRAIRAAIDRLAEQDAALGKHLSATVRTGIFCSYMPDPRDPIGWEP